MRPWVSPEVDCDEELDAVLADRLAVLDERREPATGEAAEEPPIRIDVLEREAACPEDAAGGLLSVETRHTSPPATFSRATWSAACR